MNNSQYYRLELDDVSAPSFTSFGKFYCGTMSELKNFIHALETADYVGDQSKDLLQAFRDYLQGDTDVTHSVAYREVPLLKAVHVIHEKNVILTDYSWEHRNTWGCPYYMRCSRVKTRHLWLDCGGTYSRVLYAHFTGLEYLGVLKQWKAVGTMLWGCPEILSYKPPHIFNWLAEPEKTFVSESELEKDWRTFHAYPIQDFTEFCNDIFGDG